MSKSKRTGSAKLTLLIRILVVLIFLSALVITAGRLIEFNRRQREAEALEKEKEKYGQTLPPQTEQP